MKKNSTIILFLISIVIIIVFVITIFFLRNTKDITSKITMKNLYELEDKIDSKEDISIEYFKGFELKEKIEENNIITYIYNMNEKYDVRVTTLNDVVTNIVLYNTVISTNVDIMYYSLENYLVTE